MQESIAGRLKEGSIHVAFLKGTRRHQLAARLAALTELAKPLHLDWGWFRQDFVK
jgi:hypothetical protein